MMKDSPFSDAKALLVTFSEVNVHAGGRGVGHGALRWRRIESHRAIRKKLETAQDILGVGLLPAGHYTQLRRLLGTSATIYFQNASSGAACAPTIAAPAGTNAPVTIPSGELKLNREFDLASSRRHHDPARLRWRPVGAARPEMETDTRQRQWWPQDMMTPVIGIVERARGSRLALDERSRHIDPVIRNPRGAHGAERVHASWTLAEAGHQQPDDHPRPPPPPLLSRTSRPLHLATRPERRRHRPQGSSAR